MKRGSSPGHLTPSVAACMEADSGEARVWGFLKLKDSTHQGVSGMQ